MGETVNPFFFLVLQILFMPGLEELQEQMIPHMSLFWRYYCVLYPSGFPRVRAGVGFSRDFVPVQLAGF